MTLINPSDTIVAPATAPGRGGIGVVRLSGPGVPEIAAYLAGEIDGERMVAAGQQATRNYAKRQFTWFRRQPPAEWPRARPPHESEYIDINRYFASLLRQ